MIVTKKSNDNDNDVTNNTLHIDPAYTCIYVKKEREDCM